MVKTETKPKVVIGKKPKVVAETREALFLRLAKLRTEKVLKAMRILGNCANRNNYSYTSEQIEKINSTLSNALIDTIGKFTPSKKEIESFEF